MGEWNDPKLIGVALALWLFVLILIWKVPTFGGATTGMWEFKMPLSILSLPAIYLITVRMN